MSPTDQFLEAPLKYSQAFIDFMNEERKPKEKPKDKPAEKQPEVEKPCEIPKIEEVKQAEEIKVAPELPEINATPVPSTATSDTKLFQS